MIYKTFFFKLTEKEVEIETKSCDKKQMMAGKNNETGLFFNTTFPLYNLPQQGYANVLHNQRLN